MEDQTITVRTGDMLQVDPSEAHTFLSSIDDYFHFVIHTPGLTGTAAEKDKDLVDISDLGL